MAASTHLHYTMPEATQMYMQNDDLLGAFLFLLLCCKRLEPISIKRPLRAPRGSMFQLAATDVSCLIGALYFCRTSFLQPTSCVDGHQSLLAPYSKPVLAFVCRNSLCHAAS